MAELLVPNDILRVVFACRHNPKSQIGECVVDYKVFAGGGATIEGLSGMLYTRVVTQFQSWLPTMCSFSGVSLTRTSPRKYGPIYNIVPVAGINGANCLPAQVSGLIRKTAAGDPALDPPLKPIKGRCFVPFISADSYSGVTGLLNGVGVPKIEAIRAVLGPVMNLPGGCVIFMVVKRTKTNPPPAPPTQRGYTEVSFLTSLRSIATQRRRGDFGRINPAFGGIT